MWSRTVRVRRHTHKKLHARAHTHTHRFSTARSYVNGSEPLVVAASHLMSVSTSGSTEPPSFSRGDRGRAPGRLVRSLTGASVRVSPIVPLSVSPVQQFPREGCLSGSIRFDFFGLWRTPLPPHPHTLLRFHRHL